MSELQLYNTRTRKLETFKPLNDNGVGMYACGPTVYAPQHIGNMRYFIFVDILKRTFQLNDYTVKHVMNITDVGHLTSNEDTGDDKMEASAKRQDKSAADIAKDITDRFLKDLAALHVELPDVIPYATKTIDWQIELIQKLEQKGVTYRTSDGIYFDTSKFPAYGQLSGQKAADKKAGARVEVNTEKHNPSDFALWKFSKPEDKRQMEWPSPWGVGFPGWHIECSAMSMKELGEQFDIHTGGVDHIAVHHENEIAQSEAATGKHPFVNVWMHGEFLVLPGKRMGKSEGNSITLQDVTEKGISPLAFRYLVLQAHYRKQLSFTWKSLEAAADGLNGVWSLMSRLDSDPSKPDDSYTQTFREAVNDDLNTAKALAVVQEVVHSTLDANVKVATLIEFDSVLALDLNPEAARRHVVPTDPRLESMLEDYEVARKEKRFTDSDKLRKKFEEMGVTVEDTPAGSRLRKK